MTILVHTEALIGLGDTADRHHDKSTWMKRQATIYVVPTTLAEFALVASGKIGMEPTKQIVDVLVRAYISLDIDQSFIAGAKARYDVQTSKEHSLFDCFG